MPPHFRVPQPSDMCVCVCTPHDAIIVITVENRSRRDRRKNGKRNRYDDNDGDNDGGANNADTTVNFCFRWVFFWVFFYFFFLFPSHSGPLRVCNSSSNSRTVAVYVICM